MSRPRRLPPARLVRIGGWTALATAGVTSLLARLPVGGAAFETSAPQPVSPAAVVTPTTAGAALPAAPPGGLLVLYLSPTPGVPAAATPAAPAAGTAATGTTAAPAAPQPVTTTTVPAPPPVTSSGS